MDKLEIKDRNLENGLFEMKKNGIVPGVMFGPKVKSTPVKMSVKELRSATESSGEVYRVKSKNGPVFVKFGEIQRDPVSREFLHFSLEQMPKGEESEIELPIILEGTPKGLKNGGVLVVLKNEITVNGKPSEFPDKLHASVNDLDIGDKLTINDLNLSDSIDAVEDKDEVIAVCKPPIKETSTTEEESILIDSEIEEKDSPSFPAATAMS